MHVKHALVAGLALLASLLSGCQDDTTSSPPANTWYGLASNTCGPTDGPMVSIVFDSTAYSGCQDSHPHQYQVTALNRTLDSLKVGEGLYRDQYSDCFQPGCNSWKMAGVVFRSADSASFLADFTLKSAKDDKDTLVRTGTVLLKKCPEHPMCG
jgi:hypothetical protein